MVRDNEARNRPSSNRSDAAARMIGSDATATISTDTCGETGGGVKGGGVAAELV